MMDAQRKADANRKYFNDPVFHNLVDRFVASFSDSRLTVDDASLAVELAIEIHHVADRAKVYEP